MNEIDNVISVMASQNDFQLEPIEQVINFDQGYKKICLTNEQKKQMSMALQHLPELTASARMANAYVAKFPDGINHTLISLKQGGVMSSFKDSSGHFAGTASLYSLKTESMIIGAFSTMAIASGQYFIKQINTELKMINQSMDRILEFLYGDKKAELLSEVSFVKYAYENYSTIMSHKEQRTATIISLQEAKKVAMKDIEFYMCDLDATVNCKLNMGELSNNAFRIKESLELSIQLYGMSSVLEMYFAQNHENEYIKYIEREVTTYIDKCEKRILSSFSALKKYINDYKGKILEKVDKTQYEKAVNDIIESLNTGEESMLRKSLRKTLQAASTINEYYISSNGDIYIKTE